MATVNGRVLRRVNRPARYTGGEWNSVRKSWEAADVHVCLVFPDLYEAGVFHPALASLYQTLNDIPSVLAERVFAPLPDFAAALRSENLPLTSIESNRPVKEFDIVAVCFPRELVFTAVLEILDLSGLPFDAVERNDTQPLVIGWEDSPTNPEPMAAFIDLFLVGDAEVLMSQVVDAWRDLGGEEGGRPSCGELFRRVTTQPGMYVPSLHPVGNPVQRVAWKDLSPAPTKPIVPYLQAIPDRPVVEIQRGCDTSCESVGLGLAALPLRQRVLTDVVDALRATLQSTGVDEIGLGAPFLCGYPDVKGLVSAVADVCSTAQAKLRLPTVPIEMMTPSLLSPLAGMRTSLTVGPVAAGNAIDFSTALRTFEETARQEAVGAVRIEAIIGHPDRSGDGLQEIASFPRAIRRATGGHVQTRIEGSIFVPRPFTSQQRQGQASLETVEAQLLELRGLLGRKPGLIVPTAPKMSQIEAALARGDRRLSRVIRRAWESGCVLDTRSDLARPDLWQEAFEAEGLDPAFYATRSFSEDDPLPWDNLATPASEGSVVYSEIPARSAR